MNWADAATMRKIVGSAEKMKNDELGPPEPTLVEWYEDFCLQDGTKSEVKVVRPASPTSHGGPLVALIFGGSWISGSQEQMTPYARGLARAFGAVVVNIGYRLAPQYAFPTQATDCFEALKWTACHATRLRADPSKGSIVGGPSAGANCAAAAVSMAQKEALAHPVTGQWLAVPAIFTPDIVPEKFKQYFLSREQNSEAPILNKAALEAIEKHVRWDGASPLRYPTLSREPLAGLPPTFFQVCGMDPLRDDGLIYEEMLQDAGVQTRINLYSGCPHGHWNVFEGLEVSKQAYADVMTGIGWLLNMDIAPREGLEALVPRDR